MEPVPHHESPRRESQTVEKWQILSRGRQVGAALLLMALGAGIAIGLQRWAPWDSGEVSPPPDTPRLEAADVFDLFVAACGNTSAYQTLVRDVDALVLPVLSAPAPADTPLGWLVRREYPWRGWLDRTFTYEGGGWWRIQFAWETGLWRIHEDTGEVRPACK
jgi:hypothetical protein